MTTVFVSFRDVSQLGPPTVCVLLLTVFGLPSVFIAGGLMMLAATRGTEIKICAVGVDAVQAVEALSDLVKRKFDEE